jgi:hypothetical protein
MWMRLSGSFDFQCELGNSPANQWIPRDELNQWWIKHFKINEIGCINRVKDYFLGMNSFLLFNCSEAGDECKLFGADNRELLEDISCVRGVTQVSISAKHVSVLEARLYCQDPWHFGMDPEPRIRTSGQRIRVWLFSSVLSRCQKNYFFCLLIFFEGTFTSLFTVKSLKEVPNSRNQGFSNYFCLMMGGSGSVPLTNGSGSGSTGDPKTYESYGSVPGSGTLVLSVAYVP